MLVFGGEQEAKKEAAAAGAERDRAVQALQATVTKYQTQLDARLRLLLLPLLLSWQLGPCLTCRSQCDQRLLGSLCCAMLVV